MNKTQCEEATRLQIARFKNCPHPKDQRVRLGYGIFCTACEGRLAMVGTAEGKKLLEEALEEDLVRGT
jgi:hypothetical protein